MESIYNVLFSLVVFSVFHSKVLCASITYSDYYSKCQSTNSSVSVSNGYYTNDVTCVEQLKNLLVEPMGPTEDCGSPPWDSYDRRVKSTKLAQRLFQSIIKDQPNRLPASQITRNSNGAGNCLMKNSLGANGALRICSECATVTDLGDGVVPQFVNEITCIPDEQCFGGEGICMQKTTSIQITTPLGQESYQLKTGCCCGLYPGSVLVNVNQ